MGNVRHYYQFRASGKTVTGQLVASYEYDAFGREVRAWGLNTPATNQPPGLPASRPWADLLPFHYSSKLRDADSGFNYYGYRFYDPGAGRWLNRDPIGEEGGVNLYGFCQNQPTGLIDVFGGFPAGGYVGGPSGVASFNVDGHGSGKWYPTSPEEKERILAMQQAAIELVIPIEAFRQLMNGNIIAASGDLILGRLKFLKLATKLGTRRIADSGGKCCVAVEAQIVKMPLKKGRISPLAGCAPANSGGRLVHMSGASDDILASGKLGLPSNNYAGPAANSGRSGWGLTGRTGLSRNLRSRADSRSGRSCLLEGNSSRYLYFVAASKWPTVHGPRNHGSEHRCLYQERSELEPSRNLWRRRSGHCRSDRSWWLPLE
jgi:RHS repeat-associated protein